MDLIVFTTYKNKPLNIIVEDFTVLKKGEFSYIINSAIIFNVEENKHMEIDIDSLNDEHFIDAKIDELIERYNRRKWLSQIEIL